MICSGSAMLALLFTLYLLSAAIAKSVVTDSSTQLIRDNTNISPVSSPAVENASNVAHASVYQTENVSDSSRTTTNGEVIKSIEFIGEDLRSSTETLLLAGDDKTISSGIEIYLDNENVSEIQRNQSEGSEREAGEQSKLSLSANSVQLFIAIFLSSILIACIFAIYCQNKIKKRHTLDRARLYLNSWFTKGNEEILSYRRLSNTPEASIPTLEKGKIVKNYGH